MVSARQNEITSVRKQFSIYWGATCVMPSVLANFPFRFLWAFVMMVFRSHRNFVVGISFPRSFSSDGPTVCIYSMYSVTVPRVRTSTGQRSFAFQLPSIWNSLPSTLRDSNLSLRAFKGRLKTYLFGRGQ